MMKHETCLGKCRARITRVDNNITRLRKTSGRKTVVSSELCSEKQGVQNVQSIYVTKC